MGKIWFCAHEKYNSTHYSCNNQCITTLNAVSGYNATVYFSFETYVLFSL